MRGKVSNKEPIYGDIKAYIIYTGCPVKYFFQFLRHNFPDLYFDCFFQMIFIPFGMSSILEHKRKDLTSLNDFFRGSISLKLIPIDK